MTPPTTIRLYGTAPDSIVDGPGLRFAVFVQGCTHGCPGCHNPDSQPACGGEVRALDDLVAEIAANGLVQGVTVSGGEPFEQAAACAELARRVRGLGLNVWTYTGYRYEDLAALANRAADAGVSDAACDAAHDAAAAPTRLSLPSVDPAGAAALLAATDVLVDGPFVQALHSFELAWRGSSNQRLIDVPATRATGRVVLWDTHEDFPEKPASW
ncbi:4Fe-4S single cluster domain-containing protein [Gordonibacter massiliensis (ex Traore et al. 2017)]|uniref:4Fe-4S single cluster domain-containing protein n=1 Tax=Gordonibacter massiliensis (ex Traore et al. 2017) TaxID=1841863 RepID=UPI001C8BB165|nr:4Fe-4S single cluster domain-containing protein [Gordonibacter massiliensis (ex Traore et al. 2017)]MBX9033054.1 radical SAM protein [Gordonibacter massiliensis (ex Traore et al. 2017)]